MVVRLLADMSSYLNGGKPATKAIAEICNISRASVGNILRESGSLCDDAQRVVIAKCEACRVGLVVHAKGNENAVCALCETNTMPCAICGSPAAPNCSICNLCFEAEKTRRA